MVARVNEKIAAQRASVRNLASAVGLEFANVHRDFEKRLAAERAARVELERQLGDLCGELATARTLADLAARLDRIEGVAPPAERTADAASPRLRAC